MMIRPLREIDQDLQAALAVSDFESAEALQKERHMTLKLTGRLKKVKNAVSSEIEESKNEIYADAVSIINASSTKVRQCHFFKFLAMKHAETAFAKYWASKGHDMSVTLSKMLLDNGDVGTSKEGSARFFFAK